MKKIMTLNSLIIATAFFVSSAIAAPEIGKPAPDFTLKDQNGKRHTLSQYKGNIVVLEWTNPECPFVRRHYRAKTMTTLSQVYGNDKVVWLAIDSSHFVTPSESKSWIKEHHIKYPILQDPSGKVGRLYEAKTTPHMYVIDQKGNLQYKGAIDNDSWGRKSVRDVVNYVDNALKALLSGKAPDPALTKPYGCSVKYN